MFRKSYSFMNILIILMTICTAASAQQFQIQGVPEAQFVFEFSETVKAGGDPRDLAVAFHSITFIDSIGHSLGEVVFGTAEANVLQGQGWFSNEIWPEIGSFQWAGGAAKKSELQLMIPNGTEGLLLHIISAKDSLWMGVKIDGQPAATLRVDEYWRQGYVPVGEPVPEPKPGTEPEWIEGRYFPHFPATDRIYALRARTTTSANYQAAWHPDWRVSHTLEDMMSLTLVGMQGLINRNKPRVYFDWHENSGFANAFWVPKLQEHIEVISFDFDGLSAFNFLMRRYASRFAGAVIYDPDIPETINLATMIAGLEDRIMLAPQQLELPGIPEFESVTDLRQLAQEQGWDDSIESQTLIYQWVYNNLWPKLENRIIGLISPGPPVSRKGKDSEGYFPLGFAARDYAVALRLPVIYLDPNGEPQQSLFAQFLADAPSPIPVYGFFAGKEVSTVALISEYGDWCPVITNTNTPIQGGNFTVFSGVRPDIIPYRPELNTNRILATLGDRPVVAMFASDGDNLQYQMHLGFPLFNWKNVQEQRFCWSTNPTLIDLAPVAWNYYVESRQDVTLWTHISGAGYAYPVLMNETQLEAFLDYTARYINWTGLKALSVDTRFGWNKEQSQLYYQSLKQTGYLGNQIGFGPIYGHSVTYQSEVPTPEVFTEHVLNVSNSDFILNDILSRKPGEFLTDIVEGRNSHFILMGELVQDADARGGKSVFMSPAHITDPNWTLAVSMFHFSLAPGNYEAVFRLKVPDNQENKRVARITANHINFPGGMVSQDIAPSDFQEAGQYQDFTLSFALAQHEPDLSFRVEYDGTTDLYFDFMQIKRTDGPALPVFQMLGIANLSANVGLDRQPGIFTRQLENAGGIVLTADEFMAALNPEYMIELASTMIAPDDSLLNQAKVQFAAGNYFASLITVRKALQPDVIENITLHIDPKQSAIVHPNAFSVDLVIEDAANLGAFQFEIIYNTDIVHADTALIGSFLGSAGRTVSITEPVIDNTSATGKLIFGGTTSGANPGPNGSGVLATIVFSPQTAGYTSLDLKSIQLGKVGGETSTASYLKSGQVTVTLPTESWTNLKAGNYSNFYSVKTISEQYAWIAGGQNTVLRTRNGGNSWNNVWGADSLFTYTVEGLDTTTAFVTGLTGNRDEGTNVACIYRTINSGDSWTVVFDLAGGFIKNITMFNQSDGIAIGDPVDNVWTILQTFDGGNTWSQIFEAPQAIENERVGITGVTWIDDSTGYFATDRARAFHTSDGGATWNSFNIPGLGGQAISIAFNQSGVGLAVFFNRMLFRTNDNGATWQRLSSPAKGGTRYIVAHQNSFWLASDVSIYVSRDNGSTWELEITAPANQHYLSLVNQQNGVFGWSIGENNGFVTKYIHTITNPTLSVFPAALDFGLNTFSKSATIKNTGLAALDWSVSSTEPWITSVTPASGTNETKVTVTVNRENLSPGKYTGTIAVTSNGGTQNVTVNLAVPGTEWATQQSGTKNNLYDVCAISDLVAWASGLDGTVLRTINGGGLWRDVWRGADSLDILNVEALNTDTALIAAVAGEWHGGLNTAFIYRTEDGGSNWTKVFEQENTFINDITMFTAAHGIATADPKDGAWQILETHDGGATWTPIANAPTAQDDEIGFYSSVCWIDSANGWFGNNTGQAIFTADGGAAWNTVDIPALEKVAALAFNPSGLGLAAHSYGPLAITADNGANWQELAAPEAGIVRCLFAQQDTFWTLIDSALYRSDDNGLIWNVRTIAPANLRDISLVTTEKGIYGWVVGESGLIQKYEFEFDIPVLSVSTPLLDFDNRTTSQSFQIDNAGTGTLTWEAHTNNSWISSITPPSGSGADTVTVTVDRSQLEDGNYTGKLFVTSNSGEAEIILKMAVGDTINLLLNGDFSADSTGWYLFVHDSAAASWQFENEVLTISISDSGNAAGHIQLRQDNLLIENDKRYRVEFEASTAGAREISSEIRYSATPWTSYSGYQTFSLTTASQIFKYFFIMNEPTDPAARIVFDLGLSSQYVWLDNIILYEVLDTGVEEVEAGIPKQFALLQNYPNPFNPETTIRFDLPKASYVTLEIYNTNGQRLDVVVNGNFNAGVHRVSWNANDFASGVYFYTIRANAVSASGQDFVATKKLVLLK